MTDRVCLTNQICVDDMVFAEIIEANGWDLGAHGILGLEVSGSPRSYPLGVRSSPVVVFPTVSFSVVLFRDPSKWSPNKMDRFIWSNHLIKKRVINLFKYWNCFAKWGAKVYSWSTICLHRRKFPIELFPFGYWDTTEEGKCDYLLSIIINQQNFLIKIKTKINLNNIFLRSESDFGGVITFGGTNPECYIEPIIYHNINDYFGL